MARIITLTKGQVTQVDDKDYDWLKQWSWRAVGGGNKNSKKRNKFYAQTSRKIEGCYKGIKMARMILNAPSGIEVDHIDGDSLNNCRSNLRLCTRQQNCWNVSAQRNTTSRFIGISFWARDQCYHAVIYHNGKTFYLGRFKKETEAARARDRAAFELRGQFAKLNFPGDFGKALPKV